MFDKEAYGNYKLAMRFGEAISGCDDPELIAAPAATHMRPDDYVVGLVFQDQARAYPLWVIDHYHVVNDRIGDQRFFVASCERCQSGGAFLAEAPGNPQRDPLFRAVGFVNATLVLKDLRSGSHWIHYEGVGLDRRAAGIRLPMIPTYHLEWQDWLALHPDSLVMLPPDDPVHPDARHGHGREEIFSRAGMDPEFLATIVGPLDETYPENEMVLGISAADGSAAYPLREVQREEGVVHDSSLHEPIVVFAGPTSSGFTMAAFSPFAAGRSLSFRRLRGCFEDRETGSRWTIEGRAIDGPLAGTVLQTVRSCYVRWHAWIYFHRDSRLFRSERARPLYDPTTAPPSWSPFRAVLNELAAAGSEILIAEPPVSQCRPREAYESISAVIDGSPVNLHAFASMTAARDFHAFRGAWSGFPIRPRSHDVRTRRLGSVVVESVPEVRFVDPANVVPLPPSVISWSKTLTSEILEGLEGDARPEGVSDGGAGFLDVVRGLRLSGFEVIDVAFLPPGQLRPRCRNAVSLTIDAERFLLYRFERDDDARDYASSEPHSIAFGPFVLRSTPETMYLHQRAEILYAGDQNVLWSALLQDQRLQRSLEDVVTTGAAATGSSKEATKIG